jgi:hypothetical protein
MNTEEMLSHKPVMSTQINIEKWSDVVLRVILIDGTPFVCDQNGLPIVGQKDISIQSVAGKSTTFTATFRQLKVDNNA